MYGITPRAKIENCSNPPPEIALYNSHSPRLEIAPCVPGTGIVLPIINMNKHRKFDKLSPDALDFCPNCAIIY